MVEEGAVAEPGRDQRTVPVRAALGGGEHDVRGVGPPDPRRLDGLRVRLVGHLRRRGDLALAHHRPHGGVLRGGYHQRVEPVRPDDGPVELDLLQHVSGQPLLRAGLARVERVGDDQANRLGGGAQELRPGEHEGGTADQHGVGERDGDDVAAVDALPGRLQQEQRVDMLAGVVAEVGVARWELHGHPDLPLRHLHRVGHEDLGDGGAVHHLAGDRAVVGQWLLLRTEFGSRLRHRVGGHPLRSSGLRDAFGHDGLSAAWNANETGVDPHPHTSKCAPPDASLAPSSCARRTPLPPFPGHTGRDEGVRT